MTQSRETAFGELDVWLARAGRHEQLYEKLGAHLVEGGGVRFAVWAPNANEVSVIGDFNDWDATADPLSPVDSTGIWEGVVQGATLGQRYKYLVAGREKAEDGIAQRPPAGTRGVGRIGAISHAALIMLPEWTAQAASDTGSNLLPCRMDLVRVDLPADFTREIRFAGQSQNLRHESRIARGCAQHGG